MNKLRVKNFGPIRTGLIENDGWIDVKKVTVFLGNQGTGKSTVAKLISTFTWLEKVLMRGDITEKELIKSNALKKYFDYHRISNYFTDTSYLEYQGNFYHIQYKNNVCTVKCLQNNNYQSPQIMYVPSERNFISYVDKPELINLASDSLKEYIAEFDKAKESLNGKLTLPLGNASLKWEATKNELQITSTDKVKNDYTLKLSEASSGYQSSVPLYLVTRYLTNKIQLFASNDSWRSELTIRQLNLLIEKQKDLKQYFIKQIESQYEALDYLKNKNINSVLDLARDIHMDNENGFDAILLKIKETEKLFIKSYLINIVEEPEQNLYPESQNKILQSLLSFNNEIAENKLVITSHSPYLVNVLSVAIKVNDLLEKAKNHSNFKQFENSLSNLFSIKASIANDDVAIYELSELGEIKKLPSFDGLPIDENLLNVQLRSFNELFGQLFEIEEAINESH